MVDESRLPRIPAGAGHWHATPSSRRTPPQDAPRQRSQPCMGDKPARGPGKAHRSSVGHEHGPRKRRRAAAPLQKVSACMHIFRALPIPTLMHA